MPKKSSPQRVSVERQDIMEQAYNLESVVATYKDMVYSTALSILQQKEWAEDAAQDVFIKLYEKLGEFREEASLKTYLYRITVNAAIDIQRREKRKGSGWFKQRKEEDLEESDFDHPGVLLDKREDARMLFSAIKKLPDQQKLAYVLQKIEGLPVAEIAAVMESKTTAVESLLARAKNNLRKTLTEKLEN